MNSINILVMSVFLLMFAGSSVLVSQEKDRSKIPDKYKWNLSDIYPTKEAWEQAKEKLSVALTKIDQFKGTLNQSPQNFLNCLETISGLSKEFGRLTTYASLAADQDTRDSKYLAMSQEIGQIGSTFGAKAAFIEP
jgi:oligoendopeptidase F